MAIIVKDNLFTLQTRNSTYQMKVDCHGVLLHTYYGKQIDPEDLEELVFKADTGFSGNPPEAMGDRTYSLDLLPQELPSSGVGDFRNDMLRMTFADGSTAADFRFQSWEVVSHALPVPGMPALYDTEEESAETLVLTMKEKVSDVVVRLYYGVFEEANVITRAMRVENAGNTPVVLEKALSCSLDYLFGEYEMIHFAGRHAMERNFCRVPVGYACTSIGSVRGTSSHHHNPGVILCRLETTETFGDCYGFCLVYSGNFLFAAQKDQKNQTRVQMGIHPDWFRFTLEEGEAFDTPQVILSYSENGLTQLSQQYHHILREHMCRGKYKHAPRPVLINNWEATYFDFNRDKILNIARQASQLGIEMLVLDDGWFGKRDDDNSGLGDWFVNEKKMGGTLKQLGEDLHNMGMKFGLWFEPEMISEDSDLYRAHPDWAIQIPGREPTRSRNQLVLDMSRKEIRDYLLERMTEILGNAPIDYVKWDMNRSISDVYSHTLSPMGRSGEIFHRYVLGVYDLMERLLQRFPDLLLEGCSGGGGRFDAGMLYYSPQIWCSDNTDAINRLRIQYGTSFFYPISAVGAHVSAVPNHQTGRETSFKTRGNVALSGSFGYELDLNKVSDEEKEMVKTQIADFKHYYDLTHEGEYYRLTGLHDRDFMAWGFVAQDRSRAMVTMVKTDSEGNPIPVNLPVKGLADDRKYRCSYNGKVHTGRVWNQCGLTLSAIPQEYDSLVVEWTAED